MENIKANVFLDKISGNKNNNSIRLNLLKNKMVFMRLSILKSSHNY
jgi:hypothetical protein